MIVNYKSQISVFEMPLLILLFSSAFVYVQYDKQPDVIGDVILAETLLDSVYHNDTFRYLLVTENIASASLQEDWAQLKTYLDRTGLSYEIKIEDLTNEEFVYTCNAQYSKVISQRIIAVYDGGSYSQRTITFGVCY